MIGEFEEPDEEPEDAEYRGSAPPGSFDSEVGRRRVSSCHSSAGYQS